MLRISLFICFIWLTAAAAWGEPNSQDFKAREPRKKLIVWGGLDFYSPEAISTNIRKYEELPFDGTVLSGFKLNKGGETFDWRCFGKEKFEREDLSETIESLKAIKFRKFTDNFLRYNVQPSDVDWFDDFGAICHNARMWAEVAKETRMKGFMFDLEDYRHTIFIYKKRKYANEKSFDEYVRQVQLRGKEFIEAVQTGYPDIVVILTMAQSSVNRLDPNASKHLSQLEEYNLLPAFVNGMIEGAGPQVRIVDGQEQSYGCLTAEDYYRGYHSIRQTALSLVPPELWGKFRSTMDVGVAMMANCQLAASTTPGNFPAYYMPPQDRIRLLEQDVYYALKSADEYVWFYSEYMNWCEPGALNPTPPGTLDAVRSGREKVLKGEPLGFDMGESIAAAKIKMKETLSQALPVRHATVPRVVAGKTSPKIDGVLDEAVWKDALVLEAFVPFVARKVDKALTTTVAQAAFDDENLYIAFRCAEPQPGGIFVEGQKKDDAIWGGDCVGMFLSTGAESIPFHFIVNPNNVQWDGKADKSDWNGQWQSGAKIGDKEWTVEVAIPWKTIGGKPASGVVRANLWRHRVNKDEYTTWSPMFNSCMEPDHLGVWELAK